jgi:hypothetical protein
MDSERFDQYTYGRKVIVQNDHKLQAVILSKPLTRAPKRLQDIISGVASLFCSASNLDTITACEIATCKQNVEQKEDLMHLNFQMDISLPWIDAAFT